VRRLGVDFERPAAFDLDAYLADSWTVYRGPRAVAVVLRFAPSLAPLIEHGRHHAGETVTRLADGWLEYRVRLNHLDEIARWVVGFGGGCTVVKPVELRRRVEALGRSTDRK
jgi:predicted DNA-binding transcriptional regulator YafY